LKIFPFHSGRGAGERKEFRKVVVDAGDIEIGLTEKGPADVMNAAAVLGEAVGSIRVMCLPRVDGITVLGRRDQNNGQDEIIGLVEGRENLVFADRCVPSPQ
jgi:hypothetical protein